MVSNIEYDLETDFKEKKAASFFDFSKLSFNPLPPATVTYQKPFGTVTKLPKVFGNEPVPLNPELPDLLDDAYDHPMSLTSFESYLTYIGKVENLYFINWLRDYTLIYEQGAEFTNVGLDSTLICSAKKLKAAYETGLKSFLTVGAPLEIKLATNTQLQLSNLIEWNQISPLAPSSFLPAQEEIMIELEAQFKEFLGVVLGNVGMRTILASRVFGGFNIMIGLLPFIFSLLSRTGKGLRFIGVPLLYFGLAVIISGMRKTCLVLFTSSKRRLLPWEYLESNNSDLATSELSPTKIDSNDSSQDFSLQLRHYSPEPLPIRPPPFDNMLGPLTTISAGTAALYYYHQNQLVKRTAIYALLALVAFLIPMALIP